MIARLPKGVSLVRPGSHCPKCETPLRWRDNIPVLSYLLLRGRCRSCQAAISVRYPVIELLTAFLFLAVTVRFHLTPLTVLRDWPFVSLMVAITFIDLERRIIPDRLNIFGAFLGLASAPFVPGFGFTQALLGALLGFIFFYSLAWLYWRFAGRSGLGGGDIKFLAMLGLWVGPQGVVVTVLVSSVLGSVIGIIWALVLKRSSAAGNTKVMQTAIPYGPFLVIGALYFYLVGDLI